jgi:hypothetical protein
MHYQHNYSSHRKRAHCAIMDLYLTNHARVRNTNFCTTDGQVMYKSETPGSLFAPNKRTTIYKIIPNHASEDMGMFLCFPRMCGRSRLQSLASADRFTDLATIAWHARPRLSKLTYDGVKMSIVTKGVLARCDSLFGFSVLMMTLII